MHAYIHTCTDDIAIEPSLFGWHLDKPNTHTYMHTYHTYMHAYIHTGTDDIAIEPSVFGWHLDKPSGDVHKAGNNGFHLPHRYCIHIIYAWNMCVCMYMYNIVYIYIYIYIYTHIHTHTHTRDFSFNETFAPHGSLVALSVWIPVYIYVYIYMYVCMYVCIYIHTHIHTRDQLQRDICT
jgi:hypothetical protein